MAEAVVVAVHDDAVVLLDDLDEGREVGLVAGGGGEGVVQLQELPVRFGVGKGGGEEVELDLAVGVAGCAVFVLVD